LDSYTYYSAVTRIPARIVDPGGPLETRLLAPLVGTVGFAIATALAMAGFASNATVGTALLVASVLWHFGTRVPKFFSPRDATLEAFPGFLRIGAVHLGRFLSAKGIHGATTSATPDGVALTIQPNYGRPLTLVVRDYPTAQSILASLGVGHHGFGYVQWRLSPRWHRTLVSLADVAAILIGWMPVVLVLWIARNNLVELLNGLGAVAILVLALPIGVRAYARANAGAIGFDMLRLWLKQGTSVAWGEIRDAQIAPGGVRVTLEDGRYELVAIPRGAMTADEQGVFVEQIRGSAQRAKGHGMRKEEPATRVDVLACNGEAVRHWLERVEMLARSMATTGYRSTSIDRSDLWTTVEDPEAATDLRAAAARVLVRVDPESRVRIDAAFAASRDKIQAKRMRIVALEEDIEEVAERLEKLQAHS